jgi:hypothetical protein
MLRACRLLAAIAAVVMLWGCPGGSGKGDGTGPGTAGGAAPGSNDAGVATAAADASTSPNLSEAECNALVDHVLDVQLTKMRAELPADKVPTDDQVKQIRENLGAEMMPTCLSAFDRPSFDCMMAATTVDALYACAPAP